MSEDVELNPPRRRSLGLYAWIIVPPLLILVLLVVTFFRGGSITPPPTGNGTRGSGENHIAAVRDSLGRQADLATCRDVVTKLNSHLQNTKTVDPLPEPKAEELRSALKLDTGDLAELNSSIFTALDAHHLETCFLLRDAARSLELTAPTGRKGKPVKQDPLDRARMAFDWVCRQVRLTPPLAIDPLPAPPGFVLRRGTGTALERAVVFVSLLEQFGVAQDDVAALQGCLLFLPGRKKQLEIWACGVVPAGEPETIYLFDPRLGLALPGPGGKGVATLKQAREEASVLGQLKFDDLTYDINPEKAKSVEASVHVPLTALSPRMRLLQDRLLLDRDLDGKSLPPPVRVKLAEEEPGALAAVRKAFESSGGQSPVSYWREGTGLLRRFVPKDDGGSDVGVKLEVRAIAGFTRSDDPTVVLIPRRRLLELAMVPWEDFPPVFREKEFSFNAGPGQAIRGVFGLPFMVWMNAPNSPRDLILRGQPARATRELVTEQGNWQAAKERGLKPAEVRQGPDAWPEEVATGVRDWVVRAFEAHQNELGMPKPGEPVTMSPQVAAVYRWKLGEPMEVLMSGAMADARGSQVTYQLGLSKHEQAVRLQARADLAEQAGVKTEDEGHKVRKAWNQAEHTWKDYLRHYEKRPGAASVRRLLAEAHLAQGERQQAAEALSNTAGAEGDLEKLAMRWLAAQAK